MFLDCLHVAVVVPGEAILLLGVILLLEVILPLLMEEHINQDSVPALDLGKRK
jgi:hypothetical protein